MPDDKAAEQREQQEKQEKREDVTSGSTGAASGTAREGATGGESVTGGEGPATRAGGPPPGGSAGDAGTAERQSSPQAPEGIVARAGSGGAREREEVTGGQGESARGDVPGGRSTAVPESGPVREAVGGTAGRLLSRDEGDKWTLRLQHAVAGFVDGPRDSVEEADQVLQEVAARFTDAVTERRRTLRTSWQTTGEDMADTEQLRLALRDYRELAERLLRL